MSRRWFFCIDDGNAPPDQEYGIDVDINRIGVETDFYFYENTKYAIMDPKRSRYEEASA
jgi:hypothetical protein